LRLTGVREGEGRGKKAVGQHGKKKNGKRRGGGGFFPTGVRLFSVGGKKPIGGEDS